MKNLLVFFAVFLSVTATAQTTVNNFYACCGVTTQSIALVVGNDSLKLLQTTTASKEMYTKPFSLGNTVYAIATFPVDSADAAVIYSQLQMPHIHQAAIGATLFELSLDSAFHVVSRPSSNPAGVQYWRTTGNTITTDTNFIGTLNAKNLVFKVHNIQSGLLDLVDFNTLFGYGAGLNNTGSGCTAVGKDALGFSNSGSGITAIGSGALSGNTTGVRNTAIGNDAFSNNNTGYDLTAIGALAQVSVGGLNNATAIGAYAYATQSNSLVLGSINGVNGASADAFVGIGTTTPQYKLQTVGSADLGTDSFHTGYYPDFLGFGINFSGTYLLSGDASVRYAGITGSGGDSTINLAYRSLPGNPRGYITGIVVEPEVFTLVYTNKDGANCQVSTGTPDGQEQAVEILAETNNKDHSANVRYDTTGAIKSRSWALADTITTTQSIGGVTIQKNSRTIYQLDSSGNMGVNTGSPRATLDVITTTGDNALFNGGNVGIGTSSPSSTLYVEGKTVVTDFDGFIPSAFFSIRGKLDTTTNLMEIHSMDAFTPLVPLTITNGFAPKIITSAETQLQYEYGTPTAGYVLTSDASGNATWAAPAAFDSTHCFTALKSDSIIACSPLVLVGTSVKATSALTVIGTVTATYGGDLTGSVSNSLTVAKVNNIAASAYPHWIKITKAYTDFATGSTTNTITVYTPAANEVVEAVKMIPTTAFTGGLIATYTLSMGQLSAVDLLSAGSVFTVPSVSFGAANVVNTSIASPPVVTVTAISTVGNLSAATQGSVNFWLKVSTLP